MCYLPNHDHGTECETAARLALLVRNPSDGIIVDALVAVYRERHPWARGENVWKAAQTRQAARVCRLCSGRTTWAHKWPRTKESLRHEADDIARHVANVRQLMEEES